MHRNEKPDMSKVEEVQLRSEVEHQRIKTGKAGVGKKYQKLKKYQEKDRVVKNSFVSRCRFVSLIFIYTNCEQHFWKVT
jgi:hypothetical protein